jgi:hypothetical protein
VARKRFVPRALELDRVAEYHTDTVAAVRLYFSHDSPAFVSRFFDYMPSQVTEELELALTECDVRSALAVLTSLEAYFRADFDRRCDEKLKDALSRHFRQLNKKKKSRLRLD